MRNTSHITRHMQEKNTALIYLVRAKLQSFDTQEQGGFQWVFAFYAVVVRVGFRCEAGKIGFERMGPEFIA